MPKQGVRLVVTQDGRKYKLITFDDRNVSRLEYIKKICLTLGRLVFVPKIIYLDDYHLLAEFVDGDSPNVKNKDFAQAFGTCMAHVHMIDVSYISSDDLKMDAQRGIEYLVGKGAVDGSFAERIIDKLLQVKPEMIRTSLVCADQTIGNFIVAHEKGNLFFTDLDSFSQGVTGYYLLAGGIYKYLDTQLFRESYLKAGGDDYFFYHELFLSMICDIKEASNSLRLSYELPVWEMIRKIRRRRQAHSKIRALEKYLNGEVEFK